MSITCKVKQNVTMANNCGMFQVRLFDELICSTLSGTVAARIYVDLVEWMNKNNNLFS